MGTHSSQAVKMFRLACLFLLIAAAFAVEEQMKVEVEAKPFVPYMLATSPQRSPYYSMLYNPFSFVGYTNPQVEMFPHQLSVMKAFAGKKGGMMGMKQGMNMYPGYAGINAHIGGAYAGANVGPMGAHAGMGYNPWPRCTKSIMFPWLPMFSRLLDSRVFHAAKHMRIDRLCTPACLAQQYGPK